mmetsp:Transcript_7698/g.16476  ORF Transcript_7698/g.16476 Transcript_7698/m.16476 type:complete len:312 (-) Transcript_7698:124-1059(-)
MGRRKRTQLSGPTARTTRNGVVGAKYSISEEGCCRFSEILYHELKSRKLCSSDEECVAIVEAVSSDFPHKSAADCIYEITTKQFLNDATCTLCDYLGGVLSDDDAKELMQSATMSVFDQDVAGAIGEASTSCDQKYEENGTDPRNEVRDNVDDDDGDYIGEGECELCERSIKLTRHHLIPRTTWPRMKKRLWNAAPIIESLNQLSDKSSCDKMQGSLVAKQSAMREKMMKVLGMESIPPDLPSVVTHDSVRIYLNQVSLLCRQCHSAVHRIHAEWELATKYNNIDKLLESDEVRKFAKWANKQRPGKHAMK